MVEWSWYGFLHGAHPAVRVSSLLVEVVSGLADRAQSEAGPGLISSRSGQLVLAKLVKEVIPTDQSGS